MSNYAQDFLAGIDPLGVYTSQYGQKAEQAGLSEGQHKAKQTLAVLGGFAGGGAVVPGTITGIGEGISAFSKAKGGLGSRLGHAAKGFLKGTTKPWRQLGNAMRARRLTSQAMTSGEKVKLTSAQQKILTDLLKGAPVSAYLGEGVTGSKTSLREKQDLLGT